MKNDAPSNDLAVPEQRKSTYFPAVDGVRAFACLWVVCFHAWLEGGKYDWLGINAGTTRISYANFFLRYGFLGVDIFFILSAFCLAYPMFRRGERGFSFREYLKKRVKRIVPPYYCAFGLFLALSFIVTKWRVEPYYSMHISRLQPLRQTIYGILFLQPAYNSSFWSLAVEARWYLLLPLLLPIYKRFGLVKFLLLCLFVCALFYKITLRWAEPGFYGQINLITSPLFAYLFTFGLGIALAAIEAQEQHVATRHWLAKYSSVGLAVTIVAIELWQPPNSTGYVRLICGGALGFFLLSAALYTPRIKQILSWKPLVSIGVASYSIYLLHEPFIKFIYPFTMNLEWPSVVQFLVYQCFLAPVLVLAGLVFFKTIEKPLSIGIRKGIAP